MLELRRTSTRLLKDCMRNILLDIFFYLKHTVLKMNANDSLGLIMADVADAVLHFVVFPFVVRDVSIALSLTLL